MAAGFPEGTPLRRASNFTYNHVARVQFLRTTYKAGPLVVLGLACSPGWARRGVPRRRWLVAALVLPLVASWPLVRGRGGRRPAAVGAHPGGLAVDAADHVDATAGDGRAVVLPGQLYAYYDWGGTIDPILPVAGRHARRDAQRRRLRRPARDRPAVDRRRARPAAARAARPARRRCWTCWARARWSPAPTTTAPAAARRPPPRPPTSLDQLGRARRGWGPASRGPRAAGTLGGAAAAAAGARLGPPGRARASCASSRPSRTSVVDGSGGGLAALAAFGALGDVAYAGDLDAPTQIRRRSARSSSPTPTGAGCSCRRGWRRTRARRWPPARRRRSTPRC